LIVAANRVPPVVIERPLEGALVMTLSFPEPLPTGSRLHRVVPVSVESRWHEVDLLDIGSVDLDAGRMRVGVRRGSDARPLFSGSDRDQPDDYLVADERLSTPVHVMKENRRCSILFHLLDGADPTPGEAFEKSSHFRK
jgi:hypothetical protein